MATPRGSKIFMDGATKAPTTNDHGPLATRGFNGKGGVGDIHNEMATSAPKKDLGNFPSGSQSGMAWDGSIPKGVVINPMATIAPTQKVRINGVTGSGASSDIARTGSFPKPGSWGE
jgi:hypothetical protein